jgi:hypothetical protein
MSRQPRSNTRRQITLNFIIKRGPLAIYAYTSYSSRAVKYYIDYSISEKYSEYVRLLRSYNLTVSDAE